MGLGKTIQAIAVSSYYQEEWPVLIVCPASMKISWANVSVIQVCLKNDIIFSVKFTGFSTMDTNSISK